jgi:hypothetical protein
MEFTFGIITNNGNHLREVIQSIVSLNIEKYEIIVVGKLESSIIKEFDIKFIDYEDEQENFSISAKKNVITSYNNEP